MKIKTKDITLIPIFTAIMAICSWISIPAAVPFTLQTFAVFLTVGLLGGRRGTFSVLIYLMLGAMGIPVFAGFTGGVGRLLGNTGGYIAGLLGSALTMWAITHFFGNSKPVLIVSMIIGLAVCYLIGTVWFMSVYLSNAKTIALPGVLSVCVLPFIIPDLLKIALAILITDRLKKHICFDSNC